MRFRVTIDYDVESEYQGDKLADQLVEFLGFNRPELVHAEETIDAHLPDPSENADEVTS